MNFSTGNIIVSEIVTSYFNNCQNMHTGYTVYFTVLTTDVTVGLLLSVWVMVLLTCSKKVSDVFALNLAVMEVVTFCFVILELFYNYIFTSATLLTGLSVSLGCFWIGRPLFKCCICVERYLAVVHPIIYFKYKALRCRLACATFIWLFTIPLGVFIANDTNNNIITAVSVPVLAIETFGSFSILRALRQAQPGGKERQEMNLMKRRAFITVLVIEIATIINLIPVIILKIVHLFSSSQYSTCVIIPILLSLTLTGSFIHPLLYLFRPGTVPCVKHSLGRSLEEFKP